FTTHSSPFFSATRTSPRSSRASASSTAASSTVLPVHEASMRFFSSSTAPPVVVDGAIRHDPLRQPTRGRRPPTARRRLDACPRGDRLRSALLSVLLLLVGCFDPDA